jgi:hypothetical protein
MVQLSQKHHDLARFHLLSSWLISLPEHFLPLPHAILALSRVFWDLYERFIVLNLLARTWHT